jgi:MoaA/NifB/PqqE/SkfB family radical SAM enzyme
MILRDLIRHLQTLPQDLPVWFTISDDCEHCYQKLRQEHITVEEVCEWKDEEEQSHFPAVVIGHGWFFP